MRDGKTKRQMIDDCQIVDRAALGVRPTLGAGQTQNEP